MSDASQIYYKFMSFAPHARLTLFMMFNHRAIFFSNINVLNDPTDCKPYLNYDMDAHNAAEEINSIKKSDQTLSDDERQRADDALENFKSKPEEPPELYWYGPLYFIKTYTDKRVSDAQVFSMSKKWDEPRMWSHYASSHRGFCLQLSGLDYVDPGITCSRVDYATRRPCILASEVCAAYVKANKAAKQQIFNKSYLQKSMGWQYEEEYRLILPVDLAMNDQKILSIPEGSYVHIPNLRIEAVIFGLNADPAELYNLRSSFLPLLGDEDKDKVKLWRVTQTVDSYDLQLEELKWDVDDGL